ncbi:MAG TPA: HAD family phosphatase [Parafilimonas sp.]|nr:HAD family phosphatase [Parafilimonas sp.]
MQKIKNIIFDLGGVILNLDFKKTELAFAALGIGNFNEYYTLQTVTPIFEKLEIGEITPEAFCDEFRKLVELPLTDEQITEAWNALLLDFPPEKINWLKEIKSRYNIYLLSNTNEIHYNCITKIFKEQINDGSFNDLFIKAYYSHKMGLRKPSKEIFEVILREQNLDAEETVFIDDSEANIWAARSIGLQTIYLPSPQTILELDL